uniref:Innexin n=1 Tax=Steinernema glaseri TaxID=37863 RepID=A0A1I8A9I0_9BILA
MMIESLIGMLRYVSPRHDDDLTDRLHYLFTPNILLAFSLLISFKQFGGRPLECMFPNKFPGSWEQGRRTDEQPVLLLSMGAFLLDLPSSLFSHSFTVVELYEHPVR